MTKENSDNSIIDGKDYLTFLADVKLRIKSAQYQALRAVNRELVTLYWDLGRLIVERQKEGGWG